MSNPLSNPQSSSWLERILTRTRIVLRRVHGVGGGVKLSNGAVIGLVVCALLVGGISLAALGREGSTKSEATATMAAASASSAAKAKATPAKAERKSEEAGPENTEPPRLPGAAKDKSAEKENAAEKPDEGQKEPGAGSPQESAAAQAKPAAGREEQEGGDFLRKREEWFYKQRAYPLDRIPEGMRQKALDHLDRMMEAQKLQAGISNNLLVPGSTASGAPSPAGPTPAAITFPGPSVWTQIGPQPGASFQFGNISGRVTAIAVDPTNSGIVYLGAAEGGVWKTTDGGATWTPLTDSQPSLAVGSIAIDPNSCSPAPCTTIYVGTGEANFSGDAYYGAGVLKSTNGGASWTQLGAANFTGPLSSRTGGTRIGAIAVQPGNANVILAAVKFFDGNNATSGVWQSLDAGATWHQPVAGAQGAAGTDLVFEPTSVASSSGAIVYAALGDIFSGVTQNGIWKSTDSGAHWTLLGGGLPTTNVGRIQLAYAPSTSGAGATIYAAIANSSTNSSSLLGTFKTTNGGTTWTAFTISGVSGISGGNFCGSQCWYDMVLRVDPGNAMNVFVGGAAFNGNTTSLFRSLDGGTTWADVTAVGDGTSIHPDQHALAFGTTPTVVLYDGTDGGVWSSTNFTAAPPTWTDLNSTLAITQFYPGHAVNPSNENDAFGGTQDNGTLEFSGSNTWNQVTCGDGGSNVYDRNTPTNVYLTCTILNPPYIRKSVLGGAAGTFAPAITGINPADAARTPFIPQIAIDRNKPSTLYTGTYRVYQSTDGASTWTPISPDLSADGVSSIVTGGFSDSNSDVGYAGTQDGQIWRTTNATAGTGAVWTNLTKAPLPPRSITSISVDGNDPNHAFVAFSGFSGFVDTTGHVFQTTDGGNTWTDVSCHVVNCGTPGVNDLANVPVNFVAFDDRSNTIYVGNDIAVFDSADGGTTWSPLGTGLPRVAVLGAGVGRRSLILHVATHGRSVWAFQLPGSTGPGPFLSSMTPSFVPAGSGATLVTLDGANFTASSVVQADGATNGITTAFVSANQLTATVPAALLTTPGTHSVTVFDAMQTPTTSKQLTFVVVAPASPLVFSILPTSGNAYAQVTNLVASGSGFVSGASLVFNGHLIAGTVGGGGTTLTATVPAASVNFEGAVLVDVSNPGPGGGVSGGPVTFTINPAAPTITSLAPSSVNAGGPKFNLLVTGTNFFTNSTVNVAGAPRSTTYVSSTQLLAQVLASDVNVAGLVTITVSNPVSGTSVGTNLAVLGGSNPVATISSLSPNSVAAASNFTLTVNNTDSSYVGGSTVKVAGVSRPTTFVSATQLTASVSSSEVATPGSVAITVFNPVPGGGTSTASNLTVNNGVPTITSLSPTNTAPAGTPGSSLTVNGTNFNSNSTVSFNGSARTTSLVNSGQVIAAILTSDLATAGSFPVTVTNSGTGGGISNSVTFTVTGSALSASLSPSPVPFGNQRVNTTGAAVTVTLTNTGTGTVTLAASSAVTISGTNAADFAIAAGTTCTNSVTVTAPSGTCVIKVTFKPGALGARTATLTVSDNATGSSQTVTLNGTGTAPTASLSTNSVNFGFVPKGSTTPAMTVTVTNTGTDTLNFAAANATVISGANAADFAIVAATTTCKNSTALPPAPGPGNSCVINLTFTPSTAAAEAATLTITDDSGGTAGTTQTASLSGTGTAGTASLSTAAVPFGSVPVSTTSSVMSVTLTNTGNGVLQLGNPALAITGTNPGDFSIASGTTCMNLNTFGQNGSCVVSLTFTPTATGARSATLTFTDDSGGTAGATQTVSLTGTGTAASVTLAPSPVNFGNQPINTMSSATTVTLTNSGTASVTLASSNAVIITGTNASDFAIVAVTGTNCANSLTVPPTNGSCVIGVTFKPVGTGPRTATLQVTDNASPGTQSVALNGTGTVSNASVAPLSIPFGNQRKGTSSGGTDVTVTNTGTATLNIASIALGGTNPTQFLLGAPSSGTACSLTAATPVAPAGNCKFGVKFTPTATGAQAASVAITDDSGGIASSTQTVSLTGTGTTATIALTPSPVPFNNQRVGVTSGPLTITLTNSGNGSVTLATANAVALSGGNVADFAVTGGTCVASLVLAAAPGPGNTCTVTATFKPSALGAETTTLTVTFQGGTPAATDNLTGTGVFPQATPTPTAVNFNNQVINTTSGVMAVTLTNGGTDVLHLAASNAAVLGGANGSDFAVAAGTTCTNGATVNTGANCVINLTFTPSALNARTATLTITDDASPTTQAVTLNGTGTNPAPAITSLSPASVTAGGAPFTLTVNGTGFVNGAVVNFNGTAKTTAFVSATQVTAAILAADIATAATVNVTVTNPAPGGGTSAAATFTINNPSPTITTLSPTSATAGSAAFTLTVNGTNFVSTSVVNFNGAAKTTTFVNVTQLTAAIAAADIAAGGTLPVTVTNAAPGGGTSAPTNFIVNNPLPTITSLAPSTATDGGAAFTLTVNGTGFVTGQSLVKFNGNAKTTTVVSATQVTAPITAVDIATAGTFPVTVTNAAPGGGTSVPTNFTVNNPAPTITTLSPSSAIAGGTAFTLTVNGTNFVTASVVNFNGAARTTTFGSATQVTAAITAADIATAGTPSVTVTNPAPGGGTSAGATFTINNAQPVLSTLSPASAAAGGAAFTLTVNGSKFVNNAVVSFNGNAKATTFGSAAQLTAAITAADIATGGAFNVIVTNPAPTVGPSAALTFNVNNPSPTVTNATVGGKTHASGGAALSMTITGTNFVSTSVVNFGTNPALMPTPPVTPTQIQVTVPASDVATAGNVNITVTNPTPGGGTSSASTFTVDGFTVSGPANTPVKAGQQATITITVTPSANGFANPVSFTVAGLPAHTTSAFSPTTVTPSSGVQTTTLTIMTTARGAAPPSAPVDTPVSPLLRLLPVLWLAAILAGLYAMLLLRRTPQRRRYAAAVPLALLLVTGAVLAGCAGGKSGTPAGAAQLTITATSGTLVQTTPANSVTLTVQ